jgi:serine O-acetyltransferase
MLFLLFSSVIPPSVVIGRGTYLSHRGMSVVIHRDSVIGENVTIGTCVTIGGRGKGFDGAPKIGNNVYIGTGAKILGDITIGNDVVIGANSVVIRSVPDGATVVGIPARQV